MALALETWLDKRGRQGGDRQVRQVAEGKGRQSSVGEEENTSKREGRTKPTGTPTLGLPPVPTCVVVARMAGV